MILTAITGQTIEKAHVFDVHLGETLAPYVTLVPLKAILPLKRGDGQILIDEASVGRVRMQMDWQDADEGTLDHREPA